MMKTTLIFIFSAALSVTGLSHERITVGPDGGRLIMLDSVATPNVEFTAKGGSAVVELLDSGREGIEIEGQSLSVVAGKRSSPTRLKAAIVDNKFVAGPLPEGDDYYIVFRLKETADAKAVTFRLRYDTSVCSECDRVEWMCTCGNAGTGKEIEVPETIGGLWAELNQHQMELLEGYADKAYEALDEVTDAYPILVAALPGKSGGLGAEKRKAVADGAAAVVGALAVVKVANTARKLEEAKAGVAEVAAAIAQLKKNYPAATANAKLEE